MIKLLLLLLIFSLAYGKNINYLLPDQNTILVHKLKNMFKHSHQKIHIVTSAFNHTPLKRAIIEATNRGSQLTLIVHSLNEDPLSLAQYEGVEVRVLKGRDLQGSIIVVDDHFSCLFPGPINIESFSKYASLVQCSEEGFSEQLLSPFLKRSVPYLK